MLSNCNRIYGSNSKARGKQCSTNCNLVLYFMEDKIEDWKALIILTGTQEEYHLQYILASSLIVKKRAGRMIIKSIIMLYSEWTDAFQFVIIPLDGSVKGRRPAWPLTWWIATLHLTRLQYQLAIAGRYWMSVCFVAHLAMIYVTEYRIHLQSIHKARTFDFIWT